MHRNCIAEGVHIYQRSQELLVTTCSQKHARCLQNSFYGLGTQINLHVKMLLVFVLIPIWAVTQEFNIATIVMKNC